MEDIRAIFDHELPLTAYYRSRRNRLPYDERAGERANQLQPISTSGEPDVSLYYFKETGQVFVVAETGLIQGIHIYSQSGSVLDGSRESTFSRYSEHDQFVETAGARMIKYTKLLPAGWSDQQVLDDLLIDGAMIGGGDLGNVRLGNRDDFPSEIVDEFLLIPEPDPTFVDLVEANALLTYDPETGDILIEAFHLPIQELTLISPSGYFTGPEIWGFDATKLRSQTKLMQGYTIALRSTSRALSGLTANR